jgi:hypothetical protein
MMEIKLNIEKSQRKALAQKISEITGEEVKYLGVPSCAYEIGIFTVTKDAVLTCADGSNNDTVETVLEWLSEAGYTAENEPEENGQDSGFPVNTSISVPLAQHTVQSLINLICMIHSRGALLSKATGGNFAADKTLTDEIVQHEFRSIYELTAFVREWNETNPPLAGISFDSDKITFDGFGQAEDADHVHTFMRLSAAMNQMALTQKRVQAKEVDDSNEKYTMRIWLVRIGFGGAEYKADRKILMENLSGHSAFRNDEEKAKWTERQKAKREAAKAAQNSEEQDTNTDEEAAE